MLDRETEEHWQAVKESYPDAVVFHEVRGSFIVRGRDTEVLRTEFDIESGSTWFGFDGAQASIYMTELTRRGYDVVRASNGQVSRVRAPADQRKEVERQRAKSRFLALEPTLLFDEGEVERGATDRWLRRRGYEELFDSFKRWLSGGDWRSLRDYGELYIYQVGDWYEVDLELTSMLEGHVLLLAKAALATGRKVPCRVVEPKCRRERRSARRPPDPVALAEKTPRLGQLSFEDIIEGWSG